MGSYAKAAKYYDLLYGADKNYAAEAELIATVVRTHCPDAKSVLDVGCGTAAHGRHLVDAGFTLHGLDLEPEFVDIAQAKCPEGEFHVGDMRSFELATRYDAVVSLFSAIGYVGDVPGLNTTLGQMAKHLNPGGVIVVDPWFEPGVLTPGFVMTVTGETDGVSVARMSRTLVDGSISRLEFEYLIGTAAGIERLSEVHELGLFTQGQMEGAFRSAGLLVHREQKALRTRGMYVGQFDTAGPY